MVHYIENRHWAFIYFIIFACYYMSIVFVFILKSLYNAFYSVFFLKCSFHVSEYNLECIYGK